MSPSHQLLLPDPRLSVAQQAVIARDYGMRNGRLKIPTRSALVSYVLQQLRVDSEPGSRSQVVIGNAEGLAQWLI